MSTSKDPEAPGHGNDNPPPPETMMTDKPKLKSSQQTCCVVMAILFFMSTAVFTALFVVYYTRPGQDIGEDSIHASTEEEEVCNTPNCVTTASRMIKLMNVTVDPCEDFSEFACGQFYKETKLSAGMLISSIFTTLDVAANGVVKEIITEEVNPGDPQYLINMKRFYKSCLDEDRIEEIGVAPFLNDTDFVNNWPTLNPAWNGSSFNLSEVMARYAAVDVLPFFAFTAYQTLSERSKNKLLIHPPEPMLPEYYFVVKGAELTAYQTYLTELAMALGAEAGTAARDAKAVVDLQSRLYLAVYYYRLTTATQELPEFKISEWKGTYPQVDVARVVRAELSVADMALPDGTTFVLQDSGYMDYLNRSINGFPKRTVQNLFAFTHAMQSLGDASKHLRELRFNVTKAVEPYSQKVPRSETCLKTTAAVFKKGLNKQYLLKTFTEETKTYAEEMVFGIRDEMRKLLNESTWMSNTTNVQAIRKLDLMESEVGYPDEYADEYYVDIFYENFTMTEDNYYANSILLTKLLLIDSLRSIVIPDYKSGGLDLSEPNAHYSPFFNMIEIPAGILVPPMFSLTYPSFVNYALLGNIIGHEIVHGFDKSGSELDAEGYPNNWWEDEDREEYLNRTQCFVDHYSSFFIPEINMTIAGDKTVGEDVPDNVGLKLSYRAYKELVKRTGKELKLPGLSLTQGQLFFLSLAQMMCAKQVPEFLKVLVERDVHSPDKIRMFGMLQNSEDFANAYNCPRGSYMNPEKKCTIW